MGGEEKRGGENGEGKRRGQKEGRTTDLSMVTTSLVTMASYEVLRQ